MTPTIHFQSVIRWFSSWSPRMSFFSYTNPLPLSKRRNASHHISMGNTSTDSALEFIYHIIPLVSRNQKTHFPPHLQFSSVPGSPYGCWMQTVREEGPLSKNITLETQHCKPWDFHSSSHQVVLIPLQPRNSEVESYSEDSESDTSKYSDGYNFLTWPSDKVNECQ